MKTKGYPLDALARLREARTDEAARAHGATVRALDEAMHGEAGARAREARSLREAEAKRSAEREALGRGELTVADLQRGGAWEVAAGLERDARAKETAAATVKRNEAVQREGASRTQVATKRAEAEVIASHRAGWEAERRRTAERKDEDAAEDAFFGRGSAAGTPLPGGRS